MAYNIIPQRGVFSTIANLINENFQRIYQQILGLGGSGEQAAEDISQLESDVSALQSGKANDADVVHKAGAETITGNKTFSGTIKLTTQGMAAGVLVLGNDGTISGCGNGADILQYDDENSDENIIGIGDNVDECLTKMDSTVGQITGKGTTYTVAGSGSCTTASETVKDIKGKSVVWNQLGEDVTSSKTGNSFTKNGVTVTWQGQGQIKVEGEAGATGTIYDWRIRYTFLSGHIYVYKIVTSGVVPNMLSATNSSVPIYDYFTRKSFGANQDPYWGVPVIKDVVYDGTIKILIYDLTKMFGAGNEPSTVEEFEAMYPLDYYDYNTGTLMGVNATGIKSLDSNNTQIDEISIPVTTLTGKASVSSTSVTIFPNGMLGIGTVRDEINLETGKAIKRIGSRAYNSSTDTGTNVLTDGTTTHYILETPIEYTLDSVPNTVLRTENGGTVEWLPVNTSTPTTAPIEGSVRNGIDVEDCVTKLGSTLENALKVFGCPSYAGGATVVTYNGVETALSNMGGFKTNIVLQYISNSVKVMMRYTGVNPTGNYSFGATQFDHNDGKVYVYGAEVTDTDSVYVYRSELNGTQIL